MNQELIEDLRDTVTRKLDAVVRNKPRAVLSTAFAAGFLLGGGWRTRPGRVLVLAVAPYLLRHVVERYLVA